MQMKFTISEYLRIPPKNYTIREMFDFYLYDLKKITDNLPSKLNENLVYPTNCFDLAKSIKFNTIVCCFLLEKITQNPAFLFNAESFLRNEKFVTIDVFVLFLQILYDKTIKYDFDLEFIKQFLEFYETIKSKSYKLNLTELSYIKYFSNGLITIENNEIIDYKF